ADFARAGPHINHTTHARGQPGSSASGNKDYGETSMKVNLFRKAALLAGGFALCLTTFLRHPELDAARRGLRRRRGRRAQTPPGCIQFGVSQVTHGLDVPGVDDLFLLPTTLDFTVVSPASQGGSAFPVN